ncbi:adhesion G-protein coupled receptor G2 [Ixodes scapularis]
MTQEEQRATFQCFVSPEILPDSIVWYKDGLGVKGNRLQTGLDDAVLMEVSATREHPYLQGYYWCEGITVDGFRRVESRKQLLRFSEICFSETTKHDTGFLDTLSWPATAVGSLATSNETCIHEDMRPVVRRCEGNFTVGAFWGPVQGVCLMQPSQRTLDLKALSMEEVSSESMGATADRLQQLTTEKRSLDPLDIVYVAKTVENIASTGAVSRQVAQDVVTALDNVLNAEESTLYLSRSANSTNRILGAMEQVSRRLDSDTVVFQRSVALGKISKFQESTLGVAIHLDLEQRYNFVDTRNLTQGTDVAFVFSKSNQLHLDRELNIGVMGASSLFEDSFQPTDDESSELVFEICSSVLLANYENEEVDNVREPFSIYFKQSCDVMPVEVECVFWDPSENHDLGAWSTAGCEYIGLEREYHVCNCSHLTSFAVLFRHNDRSRTSPHDHILSYLTFIGIALSALGLLMVVFTYICHKRWRKGVGHQILMHLSVALLGALGAYLALVTVPVPRTGPALCACIGGLLHYLLLVSFCWTFVEALLQYLRFVKVLGTYVPNLVLKAALAAWGSCLCGRDLIQALDNLGTPVLSVSNSNSQGKGEALFEDKYKTKDGAKDKEIELYLPLRSRNTTSGTSARCPHQRTTFNLSGVSVNAKSVLSSYQELAVLDAVLPYAADQMRHWKIDLSIKDPHFDTSWGVAEDSSLLMSIYEHVIGSWEAIKMDAGLGLTDKILPDGEQLKPQTMHLYSRADYFLKKLRKVHVRQVDLKEGKKNPKRGRKTPPEEAHLSKAIVDHDCINDSDNASSTKSRKPKAKADDETRQSNAAAVIDGVAKGVAPSGPNVTEAKPGAEWPPRPSGKRTASQAQFDVAEDEAVPALRRSTRRKKPVDRHSP